MRVLLFAAYFWPHKGGVEKYVEEVCSRLVKRGVTVDIVTSLLPGTKEKESVSGITVYRVPSWDLLGGTFPVPKFGVWSFLKGLSEYEVVVTQTRFFPMSLVGALFACKRKIPLLHVEHGTVHTGRKPFIFSVNWLYDHT